MNKRLSKRLLEKNIAANKISTKWKASIVNSESEMSNSTPEDKLFPNSLFFN